MQVKGLEFPGYEPRGSWAMGLAYATAPRGACHNECLACCRRGLWRERSLYH